MSRNGPDPRTTPVASTQAPGADGSARPANGVAAVLDPERARLAEDERREKNWKRWGPYLAERQWGTVREDYSADGSCWTYFPHDQARSRAYRWGEDGLLGITDRECRLCFAVALWNGKDPILKERLFGLTGPQGNHGEDVKEEYFYLDSTPTHSYMKALYKYPQAEFPYAKLVDVNARRSREETEYEIPDTGVFNENRYFDVYAEYAKASSDDMLIKVSILNRGPDRADVHLLPTLWARNTWSWGCDHDGCWIKPWMGLSGSPAAGSTAEVETDHVSLGKYRWQLEAATDGTRPRMLFTENHTNTERCFGVANASRYVKDAFHDVVIGGREEVVNPKNTGSKCAGWYKLSIPAGATVTVRLRLSSEAERSDEPFGDGFERVFAQRMGEADLFYSAAAHPQLGKQEKLVSRQACAGLLWTKQFYHYVVADWLDGDPDQPRPPDSRKAPGARNVEWRHMFCRDVISMPDKWEYPWFAAWDLGFHCVAMAHLDPEFAKQQLLLMTREWYMHPSGALPAYEFAFGDVNPPVHAWACWRVYKMTGLRGHRDRSFLTRAFHKLLLNFTWWVNRKDPGGKNVFGGGFLGLDNIGVFDRSRPLPTGGHLEQADGTAWMAFYCGTMLSIALELASEEPAYEDVASKFFEHFVAIADAMNGSGGGGLWNQEQGFYYDQLLLDGKPIPLQVRSMVGLIPLLAAEVIEERVINRLPGFRKRMQWFLDNRKDLGDSISYFAKSDNPAHARRLLAIPSRERLARLLQYVLDENEFLSKFGLRSLSKVHKDRPYVFVGEGVEYRVDYVPGESTTGLFGGNSNWRGPIWFPLNFLILEALERYHHFYGDGFTVKNPATGKAMDLAQAAQEIRARLSSIFLPDSAGVRPLYGAESRAAKDPSWSDLVLFHEYFHGETGRGLGASHQTGWTALVALLLEQAKFRDAKRDPREVPAGSGGRPAIPTR